MVRCSDKRIYTGITNNLTRRLAEHNSGHGCRFTKFRKPVTLLYRKDVKTKSEALKKEAEIKKLRREEKVELVRSSRRLQSRLMRD